MKKFFIYAAIAGYIALVIWGITKPPDTTTVYKMTGQLQEVSSLENFTVLIFAQGSLDGDYLNSPAVGRNGMSQIYYDMAVVGPNHETVDQKTLLPMIGKRVKLTYRRTGEHIQGTWKLFLDDIHVIEEPPPTTSTKSATGN